MKQSNADIERLFRQHYAEMFRVARGMLYDEDECKDVVSEVFAHLMAEPIMLLPDTEEAYLLRSVRNRCLNLIAHKDVRERVSKLLLADAETVLAEDDDERLAIHTDNRQRNHLVAGKAVLGYPLGKGQLSWGVELSHTYSRGEYTNVEGYVDASLTEIRENHTAGFAEYDLPLGPWSLNGGVRYEYVKSDYYSFGRREEDPSRRYANWFPSLSASWQKNMLGIQMAYACKTSRPSYNFLRNEVQYDNRYFYEGGNPYLVPTLTHAFDFALTYSWLSLGVGYSYDKDVMQWCVTLFNGQDIGFLRNLNFDHQHNVYASVVASPKWGWYQPTFEVGYQQHFFEASDYGASRNINRPHFTFSVQNRFVLPHDLAAIVSFRHNTTRYSGFVRSGRSSNLSVQLTKSFCNKAWTINLKATDLLKTDRGCMDMYGIGVVVGKDSYNYTRRASLTVTYNFNVTHSKYKGMGAGNEEKRRL